VKKQYQIRAQRAIDQFQEWANGDVDPIQLSLPTADMLKLAQQSLGELLRSPITLDRFGSLVRRISLESHPRLPLHPGLSLGSGKRLSNPASTSAEGFGSPSRRSLVGLCSYGESQFQRKTGHPPFSVTRRGPFFPTLLQSLTDNQPRPANEGCFIIFLKLLCIKPVSAPQSLIPGPCLKMKENSASLNTKRPLLRLPIPPFYQPLVTSHQPPAHGARRAKKNAPAVQTSAPPPSSIGTNPPIPSPNGNIGRVRIVRHSAGGGRIAPSLYTSLETGRHQSRSGHNALPAGSTPAGTQET
jgi:hypothetical protein